jgi:Spy/CpxP family protein refolding chaperone
MQRIRFAALGAALVLGIAATQSAEAQQARERRQPQTAQDSAGRKVGRDGKQGVQPGRALFRGITLSDAQKEQVRAINTRFKDQRQSARKEALADGSTRRPDSTEMAQMRQITQQHQAELRAVLTADQQTIFDQNVAGLKEKGRGRKGRK